MNYKEMINKAREAGVTSEKTMEQSVKDVTEILEVVKEEHPDKYWHFMRKTHETLYGPHYDKEFAVRDVDMLQYEDADGEECEGLHWTKDECVSALKGKKLPEGTTVWDQFVALNIFYADTCRKLSEEDVIDTAYLFFFDDQDWCEEGEDYGKVWKYANLKY